MDRKKYVFEASDDVKKVIAMGVTRGGAIWTDTMDVENFEELTSDYINEHFDFGDLQDTAYQKGINDGSLDVKQRVEGAYQRGLDDAWEAARKVALNTNDGGLSMEELNKIFDRYTLQQVLKEYTAKQTIEKLKAYEEKQKADDKIEVGDEVVWTKGENVVIVVTSVYTADNMEWCDGVCKDGRTYSILTKNARKTGRHFDIASILEEMKA